MSALVGATSVPARGLHTCTSSSPLSLLKTTFNINMTVLPVTPMNEADALAERLADVVVPLPTIDEATTGLVSASRERVQEPLDR